MATKAAADDGQDHARARGQGEAGAQAREEARSSGGAQGEEPTDYRFRATSSRGRRSARRGRSARRRPSRGRGSPASSGTSPESTQARLLDPHQPDRDDRAVPGEGVVAGLQEVLVGVEHAAIDVERHLHEPLAVALVHSHASSTSPCASAFAIEPSAVLPFACARATRCEIPSCSVSQLLARPMRPSRLLLP